MSNSQKLIKIKVKINVWITLYSKNVPHGMNNITNVGSDCMVLHHFESYGTLIFMCAGWVTSSFNFLMNDE